MKATNSEQAGAYIEGKVDDRWKSCDEDSGIYSFYTRHSVLMGTWNEKTGKIKIAEREK